MPFAENSQSIFEYGYRDASNYKAYGELLLSGGFSKEQQLLIEKHCESGQFFIAEQLDIPALYKQLWAYSDGPNEDDHAWHEYLGLRQASIEAQDSLKHWGTVDELVGRFKSVTTWDVTLSPCCWL
jgi:hypothetical protein